MAMGANLFSEYQNYNPGAMPLQSAPPVAPAGGSSFIPGANLALGGLGLLSNIYGAYQQNKQAKKQYRLQLKEFERQKAIEDEQRKIAEEQRQIGNRNNSAAYAVDQGNGRLAKYAGYFRGIGY